MYSNSILQYPLRSSVLLLFYAKSMRSSLKIVICALLVVVVCVEGAVRGVWLTVSGTRAPYTREGIDKVVSQCKMIGINTIYFSVWDESMLNFKPGASLQQKYPFLKMNPNFTFDPLEYLVSAAQANQLRVFAWFEYGFATSYNDPTGGPILRQYTQWQAKDQDGNLATKNNFQWMNGFHPQVQQLMIDIICSLVDSHKVDGVQGDDRLPAMPSLAGYDTYTLSLYKKQHDGKEPPRDVKDQGWVQWRADILDNFMANLYSAVKARSKMEVHMAPSVYPWSKYEYLQNWPIWVKRNHVDAILPQIYRYSTSAYLDTLQQNIALVDSDHKNKFFAGMLVGVGSNTTVNAKILSECLNGNRMLGVTGQSFFYHESLNDQRVAETIANYYRL